MSPPSTLKDSHPAAASVITEASVKDTAEAAHSHIRTQLAVFSGIPATLLARELELVSEKLSDQCVFEARANWQRSNYFQASDVGRTARLVAANLAEKSHLYKKLSEHVTSSDVAGGSLATFVHTLEEKDDERIFKPFARVVLSLGQPAITGLASLSVTDDVESRSLILRQKSDARALQSFPDYEGDPIPIQEDYVLDEDDDHGSAVSSDSDL